MKTSPHELRELISAVLDKYPATKDNDFEIAGEITVAIIGSEVRAELEMLK